MICDFCINYIYEEDEEGFICDVDMDEDDYNRLRRGAYTRCPYYRNKGGYRVVRRQMRGQLL